MSIRLDKKHTADIFHDSHLSKALASAIAYAGAKGYVASMPQLLDIRLKNPSNDDYWKNWYTANSEEHVCRTSQGNAVVVEYHGGGILSLPKRIEQAYKQGLTSTRGAKLDDKEIKDLLAGKLPNGKEAPVYSFSDFIKRARLPMNYAVVLDLSEAKKLESGRHSFDKLYDNPLVIIRSGGIKQAKAYLDQAKQVYKTETYGNWHPFAKANPDNPEGRLLFLGDYVYDGFNGYYGLSNGGLFVGVRLENVREAHAPKNKVAKLKTPSLELILNAVKPYIAQKNQSDLRKALGKLYR